MRRTGHFRVTANFFDTEDGMEALQQMMANCVIVRAEMRYVDDCIHYDAISPQFDEVSKNQISPWYEAEFEKVEIETEGGGKAYEPRFVGFKRVPE